MEWGIAFERMIHRLQETVDWPGKPKSVRGIILPLGVLHGLSDIPDPKQLELLPYFLTGGDQNLDNNVGLELRYLNNEESPVIIKELFIGSNLVGN
mgnify:CR=1 FL=1